MGQMSRDEPAMRPQGWTGAKENLHKAKTIEAIVRGARGFVFLALAFTLGAAFAEALDFGLVLSQDARAAGEASGSGAFAYAPTLSPWVSGPLGQRFNIYLSGKVGFELAQPLGEDSSGLSWRDPAALPELNRSELVWLVSPVLYLTLGRQHFEDPAGFVASGLFDGLSGSFSAGGGRFSAGAYYTGLLFRDQADIIMTGRDLEDYEKPLALDGRYFASRRIVATLGWENPGFNASSSLALGILAQFDANGGEDRLHSQYLSARYGLRHPLGFTAEGAAALGMGENLDGDIRVFFAGALGGSWAPPGSLGSRLSLRLMYSSPAANGRLGAFAPVNILPQGRVFEPGIMGLSTIRAAYALQPLPPLSLGVEASYFIRTDTRSFVDQEPDKLQGEGYCFGGEVYGAAAWTPLPDLALSFGGGAFFPGLGNAFDGATEIRWKAVLGLILSF
jgi:hypothetical protein